MRIAICSLDFGGSTTSLIEAYLKKGIDVDYYILASPFKRTSYESFELHERPFLCQIKEVRNLEVGLLRFAKYKRTDRFRAYLVGVLEIYDSRKRTVTNLLMKIFLRSLTQKISAQRYDFVNVIGQIQLTSELSILLKKREVKVIHSLHEVCKNHLEGALVHPCVLPLIKNEICINVFSQKSADDLYRLTHYSKEKISIIPFNLFNGYLEYSGTEVVKELEDIEDYVLFYGFIQPYKGLEVLYDAVTKHLSDDNPQIRNHPQKMK